MEIVKQLNELPQKYVVMQVYTAKFGTNICRISVARCNGTVLYDKKTWDVQPKDNMYHQMNSAWTGMNSETTRNAPKFSEIYDELKNYIGNDIVVCHRDSYMKYVFGREFSNCGIKEPDWQFFGLTEKCKEVYPELKSSKLADIAKHLKISYERSCDNDVNLMSEIVKMLFVITEPQIKYENTDMRLAAAMDPVLEETPITMQTIYDVSDETQRRIDKFYKRASVIGLVIIAVAVYFIFF